MPMAMLERMLKPRLLFDERCTSPLLTWEKSLVVTKLGDDC